MTLSDASMYFPSLGVARFFDDFRKYFQYVSQHHYIPTLGPAPEVF
ncbi:hypothetical protein [Maribellus maritimus]|nr:hypothetical protein [Maribellus maritimus]MCG6187570.1 hypothetical protein [Maribellus maritimus]